MEVSRCRAGRKLWRGRLARCRAGILPACGSGTLPPPRARRPRHASSPAYSRGGGMAGGVGATGPGIGALVSGPKWNVVKPGFSRIFFH